MCTSDTSSNIDIHFILNYIVRQEKINSSVNSGSLKSEEFISRDRQYKKKNGLRPARPLNIELWPWKWTPTEFIERVQNSKQCKDLWRAPCLKSYAGVAITKVSDILRQVATLLWVTMGFNKTCATVESWRSSEINGKRGKNILKITGIKEPIQREGPP